MKQHKLPHALAQPVVVAVVPYHRAVLRDTRKRTATNHPLSVIIFGHFGVKNFYVMPLSRLLSTGREHHWTVATITHSLDTMTTLDINPRKDFGFFAWPIRVFDSSSSTEVDNDENTRALCAFVLFNAGLACHHLSRSTHQGVVRSNTLLQVKGRQKIRRDLGFGGQGKSTGHLP